jgi:hypothetical protein
MFAWRSSLKRNKALSSKPAAARVRIVRIGRRMPRRFLIGAAFAAVVTLSALGAVIPWSSIYALLPWSSHTEKPAPPTGQCVTVLISPSNSNAGEQTVSNLSYNEIYLNFENKTDQTAKLYWVNFTGVEMLLGSVPPGASAGFRTYVGHLWIAKTDTGAVLMK